MNEILEYRYFTVYPEAIQPGRKTRDWRICARNGGSPLGRIEWYSAWRQYVLVPDEMTLWSVDCLTDIADAIKKIKETP